MVESQRPKLSTNKIPFRFPFSLTLNTLGRKSGPKIPGLTKMSPSSGLSPEQGGLASAQCYWDCMSGFHWDEDWKERCAPACDLAEKHGEA